MHPNRNTLQQQQSQEKHNTSAHIFMKTNDNDSISKGNDGVCLPSPFMLRSMMELLTHQVVLHLRETNRDAAIAFNDLRCVCEDKWSLSLFVSSLPLTATTAVPIVSPPSSCSGDAAIGKIDSFEGHILEEGPFLNFSNLEKRYGNRRSAQGKICAGNEERQICQALSFTVPIDISDLLFKHGAMFVQTRHNYRMYEVPCAPLPPPKYLKQIAVVSSRSRPFRVSSPFSAVHRCVVGGGESGGARCPSRPLLPPLMISLKSPPLHKIVNVGGRNSNLPSASLTLLVTVGSTANVTSMPLIHTAGAHQSPPYLFNALPAGLIDTFMGSRVLDFQIKTVDVRAWELAEFPDNQSDRFGTTSGAGNYRFGMCATAVAASILCQPTRDLTGLQSTTQRFYFPPEAICENCSISPVAVVWCIAAEYFCRAFVTNTGGADCGPPASPNSDGKLDDGDDRNRRTDGGTTNVVIDMSSLLNVVSIGHSFLAFSSAVTRVRLPTVINSSALNAMEGTIKIATVKNGEEGSALDDDDDAVVSPSSSATDVCYSLSSKSCVKWSPTAIDGILEDYWDEESSKMGRRDLGDGTATVPTPISIQHDFLRDCRSLTDIDLAPLEGVQEVGFGFMRECCKLRSIDVSPLRHITTIYSRFLSGCLSLESVDLRALVHVRCVKASFLDGCVSLTSVSFPKIYSSAEEQNGDVDDGGTNVVLISSEFMRGCVSIEKVDLRPLGRNLGAPRECNPAKRIFEGCTMLKEILYGSREAKKVIQSGMRKDPNPPRSSTDLGDGGMCVLC